MTIRLFHLTSDIKLSYAYVVWRTVGAEMEGESARELPSLVCHMTFPMLHLEFLMIHVTFNFKTTFIGELREGIDRHWKPEGGGGYDGLYIHIH